MLNKKRFIKLGFHTTYSLFMRELITLYNTLFPDLRVSNYRNNYITHEDEENMISVFAEDYRRFLDTAKTEREAVCEAVRILESNGFTEYRKGMELKAGDRIYRNNRGKAVVTAVIGTAPIDEGVRLCIKFYCLT